MSRTRVLRALGHAIRLTLFVIVGIKAIQFSVDLVTVRGWGPGALLALLLVTGAVSLVWRGTVDFRKALRRLRT